MLRLKQCGQPVLLLLLLPVLRPRSIGCQFFNSPLLQLLLLLLLVVLQRSRCAVKPATTMRRRFCQC